MGKEPSHTPNVEISMDKKVKAQSGTPGSSKRAGIRVGMYRYLVVTVIWVHSASAPLTVQPSPSVGGRWFPKGLGLEGSTERQGLLMTFLLLPYALSNILLGPTAIAGAPEKVLI